MTDNPDKLQSITKLGLPLAMTVTLVVAAVAFTTTVNDFRYEMADLKKGQADHWRKQDEVIQALELKLNNPSMYVPDPRDQTRPIGGGM